MSDRTFRRYINRYKDDGEDGLLDKRLPQESHRRTPLYEVMKLTSTLALLPIQKSHHFPHLYFHLTLPANTVESVISSS